MGHEAPTSFGKDQGKESEKKKPDQDEKMIKRRRKKVRCSSGCEISLAAKIIMTMIIPNIIGTLIVLGVYYK